MAAPGVTVNLVDLMLIAGDARGALKAARAEAAALSKEMAATKAAGQAFDSTKAARYNELQKIQAQQRGIIQQNKHIAQSFKETRHEAHQLAVLVGGHAAHKLLSGQSISPGDIGQIVGAYRKEITKAITSAFGSTAGVVAKGVLKNLPIAGHLIHAGLEAKEAFEKGAEDLDSARRRFGSGNISQAEIDLFQRGFAQWTKTQSQGELFKQFEEAATGINDLTKKELAEAIFKGGKTKGLAGLLESQDISEEVSNVAARDLKTAIEEEIFKSGQELGRALTKEEEERRVRKVIAEEFMDLGPNAQEDIYKAIIEAGKKKKDEKIVHEDKAVDIWRENELSRQSSVMSHLLRTQSGLPPIKITD